MFGGNKNLKDSSVDLATTIKDSSLVIGYTKTDKLITALYMVTDIIDKDEPLRNKLRTLGTGIISDMNTAPANVCSKISEIMSFLDIAYAINIISEMNCSILRKEFLELNQSIQESTDKIKTINRQINLSEFFREEELPLPNLPLYRGRSKEGVLSFRGNLNSKGHTRIGVQKGSTLMKALSAVGRPISDSTARAHHATADSSDILKKQRREDIINIIKTIGGNATIKDIKDRAQTMPEKMASLISCSEKTLQRELVSMVKDTVLKKTGEKRWSRYFLK
ncbi:MAG: hypothetical protein WC793_02395 [Candidatus Paceibacterota bacterium]|jgi:DNA-binding HxlR family transcriptional regulator